MTSIRRFVENDLDLGLRIAPQGEAKGGAVTHAGALGPDRAAVSLDQVLADRESQPRALAGARWVALVKALEDPPQLIGRDPEAGVRYPKFDPAVRRPRARLDTPARRAELHRV